LYGHPLEYLITFVKIILRHYYQNFITLFPMTKTSIPFQR